MNKLRYIELFGGIGALTQALKNLGIETELVDYVEIDKYAVKSFNAMNGTNYEPQDICEWDKDLKDIDLIMHGSPCQDFSLAGKQAGGDEGSGTRSSLMYETIRIVEKLKPKYVIWENVKNLLSKKHKHNFDAYLETMERLGYTNDYQVLNAKDYGIPQNRERVFTISVRKDINNIFTFLQPQELKLKLKDLLDVEVDEKYYLSEKMVDYCMGVNQKQSKFPRKERFLQSLNNTNEKGIANTISTNAGNRPVDNFIKIKEATKQGYKEAYEGDGVNISSRMKYQRGNVQPQSIQTLTTSGGNERGVVVSNLKSNCKRLESLVEKTTFEEGRVLNMDLYNQTTNENISQCLTEPHHNSQRLFDGLRIRKLTPKECWRLMGFSDEVYERAEKVNSNTQLYKQAGNSIVVNVLEAILKNLLIKDKWSDLD